MRLRSPFTKSLLVLGVAALLVAGAANAASISYWLDQTNTQTTDQSATAYDPDNALPDGTNYLQITFTDEGTAQAGDIDVTLTMLSPLTDIGNANTGIDSLFFNDANDALSLTDIIGLPSGWNPSIPGGNADGFGSYDVKVSGKGNTRQNPTLSFTIRVDGDSVNTYVADGPGGAQGTFFFAAHVAGFEDQNSLDPLDFPDVPPLPADPGLCYDTTGEGDWTPQCNYLTSVWLGGSTLVPEPSTALLLLGGLSGLAVMGRRRLH